MLCFDGLLRDIGEHRIGAAEADDGDFAEKHGKPREDVVGAKKQQQQSDRAEPQRQPGRYNPGRTCEGGLGMVRDMFT